MPRGSRCSALALAVSCALNASRASDTASVADTRVQVGPLRLELHSAGHPGHPQALPTPPAASCASSSPRETLRGSRRTSLVLRLCQRYSGLRLLARALLAGPSLGLLASGTEALFQSRFPLHELICVHLEKKLPRQTWPPCSSKGPMCT